jgi:hypothetical protein
MPNIFFIDNLSLTFLKFKAVPKVDAFAAGGISIPCILLAVAALVVSTEMNHRQQADTPQTWACKWKGLAGPKDTPSNSSNGNFGSLCSESVRNTVKSWSRAILIRLRNSHTGAWLLC